MFTLSLSQMTASGWWWNLWIMPSQSLTAWIVSSPPIKFISMSVSLWPHRWDSRFPRPPATIFRSFNRKIGACKSRLKISEPCWENCKICLYASLSFKSHHLQFPVPADGSRRTRRFGYARAGITWERTEYPTPGRCFCRAVQGTPGRPRHRYVILLTTTYSFIFIVVDMAATMERLQEYRTHNSQFCKRLFDFLSIMFTAQVSRILRTLAKFMKIIAG